MVVEGWEGFEVGGEAFGGDAVEDLGFEELVGGAGLEVEDCVDGVGFFGGGMRWEGRRECRRYS